MTNARLKLFNPSNAWKKAISQEIPNWEKEYKMAKVIEEAKKQQIEICGAGYISSSIINQIELNQARAEDYDKSLVASHIDEILSDGLDTLPIVSYDEVTNLVDIGDGHHRIKAMIEISRNKKEKTAMIPVLFVEYPSLHQKRRFLRRSNNHNSSKSNSKADWVKHIIDVVNDNSNGLNWKERQEKIASGVYSEEVESLETDKLRHEVYAELTECGCKYNGKPKATIFYKAFTSLRNSTIRTVDPNESKKNAKVLFNSKILETWHNNRYEFSSGTDAARKGVKVAEIEWAKLIMNGAVDVFNGDLGKINFVTYFPGSFTTFENLQAKRQEFIHAFEANNKMLRNSPVRVNKISFEPQFRCSKFSETLMINYVWNNEKLKFVLVEE